MSSFICPVCGKNFITRNKSLVCESGHSFDFARSGYVNLLLSQQIKAKHHGDDKLMVRSRQSFLDKGYYLPLLNSLLKVVSTYAQGSDTILDAGCGECWYTAAIYGALTEAGGKPTMLGVDISKDALAAGARRCREIELAVASVFRLPVRDASCELLLSVFAPLCGEEFRRVLKSGGRLVRVIPLEKHLWQLKKAVYSQPYENAVEKLELDGFELLEKQEIRETIHIPNSEDILCVFRMTPYYYKTSAEDQRKLENLQEIDTEIEFGILSYTKL